MARMASLAPGPIALWPDQRLAGSDHGLAGCRCPGVAVPSNPPTVPTLLVPVGPGQVAHHSPHSAQQDDV